VSANGTRSQTSAALKKYDVHGGSMGLTPLLLGGYGMSWNRRKLNFFPFAYKHYASRCQAGEQTEAKLPSGHWE